MTKLIYNLLFLALSLTLFSASCKKEKAENPVDDLPAATQEGKNTFGCLVNGEAFTPKKKLGNPSAYECYYQYVNGSQYFKISGSDLKVSSDKVKTVSIFLKKITVESNTTYSLVNKDNAGGEYSVIANATIDAFITNNTNKGELKITRFDLVNSICIRNFLV